MFRENERMTRKGIEIEKRASPLFSLTRRSLCMACFAGARKMEMRKREKDG